MARVATTPKGRTAPAYRQLLLSALTLPTFAQQEKASIYSPPEQLRNYALSTCLATAFPNSPAGEDAAAAGYLELGSGPIEAYGDIVQLAKQYLARQYVGQADVPFQTMECIDLYHSPTLAHLIRKYTAAPKKRSLR